jgi:hypothetical protein
LLLPVTLPAIPLAVIPLVAIPLAVIPLAVIPLVTVGIAEGLEDLVLTGLETHLALVVIAIAVFAGLGCARIIVERPIAALPMTVAAQLLPVW